MHRSRQKREILVAHDMHHLTQSRSFFGAPVVSIPTKVHAPRKTLKIFQNPENNVPRTLREYVRRRRTYEKTHTDNCTWYASELDLTVCDPRGSRLTQRCDPAEEATSILNQARIHSSMRQEHSANPMDLTVFRPRGASKLALGKASVGNNLCLARTRV